MALFSQNECVTLGPQLIAPHANPKKRRNWYSTTTAEFLCMWIEAVMFTKVSGMLPLARNWLVEQKESALTLTTSQRLFVGILYNSKLILLYSSHLRGRQIVENYLVYKGTCFYQHMQAYTQLSIFSPVYFFAEVGQSAKITKICTHQKFPSIQ